MDHQRVTVRFECESAGDVAVRKLTAREAISRLYSFELELVVLGDDSYDPSHLLTEKASLTFERDGYDVRTVHGQVVEVGSRDTRTADATCFWVRLAPHFEQTTLFATQEVFLDLSVPDIVKRKLDLVGLSEHLDLRLRGSYPERELVVQYRETDFAFVSRLVEHLGISYFFDHEGERDRVVFTDVHGFPRVERPLPRLTRGERKGGVWRLEWRSRMIPALYVEQEWNYRTPQADLVASFESGLGTTGGVVEYGAHHKTSDEGLATATVRAREREATQRVHSGESDQPELEAGRIVTIDGTELLVLEVEHSLTQGVGLHGDDGVEAYSNRFRAIDATLEYRPPRTTPRPRIHGVTSGVITDLDGNETGELALLDDHGRYLTRFLFDSAGSGERRASHPIRMAQPHAGAGYGFHFPLRPGTEVLIAFVDGDPDRPIIVGAVPNHITPSPVDRSNAHLNRIRTKSGIVIDLNDD